LKIEIRWHGRGGQGAVTASELVAAAAILEGWNALAFPEFGAERRGAPVRAYTRISDELIIPRTPIVKPDIVVILDPSLLINDYVADLREGGVVVVNTRGGPDYIAEKLGLSGGKVVTVDATTIAVKHIGRPIVNTAILGALVKGTGIVQLDTLIKLIRERFPGASGESNVRAVVEAYNEAVVKKLEAPGSAAAHVG